MLRRSTRRATNRDGVDKRKLRLDERQSWAVMIWTCGIALAGGLIYMGVTEPGSAWAAAGRTATGVSVGIAASWGGTKVWRGGSAAADATADNTNAEREEADASPTTD